MHDKLKIVFIGNSIVNGFPYSRNQSFVDLYSTLSGHYVINKGINGDTARGVRRRFNQDVLLYKPDLAVIMTGTNDFIYKESFVDECMGIIIDLVETAKKENIEVILLTPLSVDIEMAKLKWMVGSDVDYELVQEQIIELKKLMINYGIDNNIKVIDTNYEFSQYAALKGKHYTYYDGIHPTKEGYKFLAEIIHKYI